jgi:hypothetical protein
MKGLLFFILLIFVKLCDLEKHVLKIYPKEIQNSIEKDEKIIKQIEQLMVNEKEEENKNDKSTK